MCAPLSRLLLQEESLPPPPVLLILLAAGPAASLWLKGALNLLLRSHCPLLVLERPDSPPDSCSSLCLPGPQSEVFHSPWALPTHRGYAVAF